MKDPFQLGELHNEVQVVPVLLQQAPDQLLQVLSQLPAGHKLISSYFGRGI